MSKFLPTSGLKWIDPKDFDSMKYSSKSSKVCAIEVDPEYPKELRELENDSPLAPDKIGIKEKRLSSYQLKISDVYIPTGNAKKLVPNFFDPETYVHHYENLQLQVRLGLRLKKIHRVLEFNQSQQLKPQVEFNEQKKEQKQKKNNNN